MTVCNHDGREVCPSAPALLRHDDKTSRDDTSILIRTPARGASDGLVADLIG